MNDENARYTQYRTMLLIRRVEEKILELFSAGQAGGTTHTCIGQEANAVAMIGGLDSERDYVFSNHRNHGHYLAFGGPLDLLLAEIMGYSGGICGGRGGSQHVKYGHFLSNGVQGGTAPIALGLALGEKRAGTGGIVVLCLGDGTLGQGVLYESLNMASLYEVPLLFLVENNRYAQSTPVELGVSGSIAQRALPFSIECAEIDSTDIEALDPWARKCIDRVRSSGRPLWAVIRTYRMAAHSKGDDTRDAAELEGHSVYDPISIQRMRLSVERQLAAEAWAKQKLSEALERIESTGCLERR